MNSLPSTSKLYPFEWVVVLLFCGSIFSLSAYSFWMKDSPEQVEYGDEVWIKAPTLTISVNGAVEKPGDYQIARGKKVKDVLEWAAPLPNADLSKIKLEAVLKPKQRIRIPLQKIKKTKMINN